MKILVVNGSPRGNNSNTMEMTNAVLSGIRESDENAEIELLTVKDMDIKPCMGCMSCWGRTAGKCVIDDCMQEVHKKFMLSDLVIYSFPLYFFGMPGPMKTFVDRMMPLMETYKGKVRDIGDDAFHEFRYDVSGKKFMIISSCGYGRTEEIYDSLIKEFNFIYGKDNYTALLTPESEMFAIPPMRAQIDRYLENYVEIGKIIGRGEEIPAELIEESRKPMIPQRALEKLMNNYWDEVTPKEPYPAPHLR